MKIYDIELVEIDPDNIGRDARVEVDLPRGSMPMAVLFDGTYLLCAATVPASVPEDDTEPYTLLVVAGLEDAKRRAKASGARYLGSALIPSGNALPDDWHVFHEKPYAWNMPDGFIRH